MDREPIVIIGAGIVGLSTAYALARRGVACTVLDRDDAAGSASAGNAGIIAPGHPPLPRPGLVAKGLRWLVDTTGPLYIPPRPDPALVAWLAGFARACGRGRFERSARLLAELGHLAEPCLDAMVREEGLDCAYDPAGWFEVHRSEAARRELGHDAELLESAGYGIEWLDGDELRRREPAFAGDVQGALAFAHGASIHPGRMLAGLADVVARRGADVRHGVAVERIARRDGRVTGVVTGDGEAIPAATVVLAAGCWTTSLAAEAGIRVPMQPGKGYHVQVEGIEPALGTGSVLVERAIAVTPMGDHLRLAGTVELSGLNHRLVPQRVRMLTEGAAEYLPGVAGRPTTVAWCGLRPCTADGLPVVGWAPRLEGLFIATGHAKMGLTLGPITGRLATEWMLDGTPSFDLEAMSPARFG
ncbi:MAG: NAD(P)/FAD-dependent oxidoreductase [Planctomycetota bacterium]